MNPTPSPLRPSTMQSWRDDARGYLSDEGIEHCVYHGVTSRLLQLSVAQATERP